MDDVDGLIREIKKKNPGWGRRKVCSELQSMGVDISPSSVGIRMNRLGVINSVSTKKYTMLEKLSDLSESELQAVLASSKSPEFARESIEWSDESFKILVMSDTHIGHSKFKEDGWWRMADLAEREGVDFAYHVGDILEGMSGRPGHVYELSEIGFEAQFGKACELIEQFPVPIRGITGNHDLWYMGKADIGLNVGDRLAESLPGQWIHLGNEEADQKIGNVKQKLWHGRDGSSYASSYRTQKFVESLSGGEKPHILYAGHAHKSIYHRCRNVHVFESGTICGQTGFMRHKKLEAHMGFWINEIFQNDEGVERIKMEWIPFFERS